MAFNGSGTFTRVHNWVTDKNAATKITASRMDTEDDGFATGLSNCICKDGQSTPTANIPMGGFRLTGLGDASAATDAINRQTGDSRYLQVLGGGWTIAAVSASTVDCALGNYFTKTASGGLTWTFSNPPSSEAFGFILALTNGGTGTQTWPASVDWPGGVAPTLTTSGKDLIAFLWDGTSIWHGRLWSRNSS